MRLSKFVIMAFSLVILSTSSGHSGEIKEYYSDGALQSAGEVTETGEKTGKWRYWYRNGSLMTEGNYKDGKLHGRWNYYDVDGSLLVVKEFRDGMETQSKDRQVQEKESSLEPEKKSEEWKSRRPESSSMTNTMPEAAINEPETIPVKEDKKADSQIADKREKTIPVVFSTGETERTPAMNANIPFADEDKKKGITARGDTVKIEKPAISAVTSRKPANFLEKTSEIKKQTVLREMFWRDGTINPRQKIFGKR